jgi:hypothetical protein
MEENQNLYLPSKLFPEMNLQKYTVCPQSPIKVLKNCGAQTNWASHMRFAADYSESLEAFYWPQ